MEKKIISEKELTPKENIEETLAAIPSHPQYISLISEPEENDLKGISLEFKDWIALFIALVQTVFLPIIMIMGVFIIIAIIFRIIVLI